MSRAGARAIVLTALWIVTQHASVASAQTATPTDPALLVLDPIGAPDAATAAAITQAIGDAGRQSGYHVLTAGAGSVVGTLSPATGADLLGVLSRTGLHRAVVVWVSPPTATGYDVHVGLASSDATTMSAHASAGGAELAAVAGRTLAAFLPAPFVATTGSWGSVAVTASEPLPSSSVVTVGAPVTYPASYPATEQPAAHRSHGPGALLIAGIAVLGAGWVVNWIIGLFGGYHDRTCLFPPCSLPPTSWDPAWDNFRATSLIPLIGPWIQLAVKPPSSDGWQAFLVPDGIVQGIGLVLLIVGAALESSGDDGATSVTVVPTVGPGQAGLAALGTF